MAKKSDEPFTQKVAKRVRKRRGDFPHPLPQMVFDILQSSKIPWHTDETTGDVVIEGDLFLDRRDLEWLPDLSHVRIHGSFNCSYNRLSSLAGSPKYVSGGYYCSHNNLKSLEGVSPIVGGELYCPNNPLVWKKGSSAHIGYVGGKFFCDHRKLPQPEVQWIYHSWIAYVDRDIIELAFYMGGYKDYPDRMVKLLDIPPQQKTNIIIALSENAPHCFNQINDFLREFAMHVVYPLYVRDFAAHSGSVVNDEFLQKLNEKHPCGDVIEKLIPVIRHELLEMNAQGEPRQLDKILGLNAAWHDVAFPDELRPLRATGKWHPLTTQTHFDIPPANARGEGVTLDILTSDDALVSEGKMLGHCVGDGGYTGLCLDGEYHVIALRKNGEPVSTIGVRHDGTWKIRQNFGSDNAIPPDYAIEAANKWLEQLNNGDYPISKRFGETEESKKEKKKYPEIIGRVGYQLTPENITAAFHEFTQNEKRRARAYNAATKKWEPDKTKTYFINGTYNHAPVPMRDNAGNPIPIIDKKTGEPRCNAKGEPLFKMQTATNYRDLDAETWYEVSGLRDIIAHSPVIPQPPAQEQTKIWTKRTEESRRPEFGGLG